MGTDTAANRTVEFIKAIIILPGSALIFIPGIILYATRSYRPLCGLEFPAGVVPLIAGLAFLSAGLRVSLRTVTLFFTVGEGTPAPWAPPKRFVVEGPYRYVRNPMLLSVLSMIIAEALFTGSLPVFLWCVAFWGINTLYFKYSEEPALRRRFGEDYVKYTRNVGRWVPRRTPWPGPASG